MNFSWAAVQEGERGRDVEIGWKRSSWIPTGWKRQKQTNSFPQPMVWLELGLEGRLGSKRRRHSAARRLTPTNARGLNVKRVLNFSAGLVPEY